MAAATPARIETDLVAQRRPSAPEALAPQTVQWLASLPGEVRPRVLPIQFARIANNLARGWRARAASLAYLDDLLIDKRGNRRGFPIGIVLELAALKNYFQTVLHPGPMTVWDEISSRQRDR